MGIIGQQLVGMLGISMSSRSQGSREAHGGSYRAGMSACRGVKIQGLTEAYRACLCGFSCEEVLKGHPHYSD